MARIKKSPEWQVREESFLTGVQFRVGDLVTDAPRTLRYTWRGDEDSNAITDVTYLLEPIAGGTRFTWTHTGFTGPGGFAMSKLLGKVRRTMLTEGVPPILAAYHAARSAPA